MNKKSDKGVVIFLAPLILGNMLNPLNSTMLATAVLTIVAAFGQPQGAGALLIIPLYFTSAIGQPLMGRLCDVFNPAKINLFGFALILLSGLIGVLAKDFEWLIASRVLLGLGSSAAYPSSITLIRQRYKSKEMDVPGIVLSIVAIAGQVSLVFGPFLGGILLENFGWKGIFFINIPLVLIGLTFSIIKRDKIILTDQKHKKPFFKIVHDLDPIGLLAFSGFLFSFLITILYPSYLFAKISLTVVLLIVLIFIELKHHNPFINVRVLSLNLFLNTTFLRQIGINFIIYLFLYGLPQWMEQSKGISPSSVGLIMLPFSLMAMALSLLVSKNKNYLLLLSMGIACIIAATVGIFTLDSTSSIYVILTITITIGAAMGILTVANQATLYAEAPENAVGVCFGLFRTVGYIGAILSGTALKYQFKTGATDKGLHSLAFMALFACLAIILFLLPLFFKRKKIELKTEITI
ncbi:MFS transporter [Sphingobacterium siyangense]|uniref:MFS transporter n=1 Tax=Sphingobacterium siyangense TaxID=459529 RepID=UPI0031F782B0